MVHSTNAKAYIKNFVEDSGDAFDCRTLGYCPRMSFVITNPDGSKKSISLGSDPDAFFDPDAYALYQKTFAIDSRMADAQAITFFFENAKVKPLLVFFSFVRGCLTDLYFSNNFATSTLIYFIKPGNGYYLDEVTITKLSSPTKSPSDTYYPTFSPSLGPMTVSPSFGPTTTRNCDQWVMNPGAERGDTSSWKV